jgi:hypothetical protein
MDFVWNTARLVIDLMRTFWDDRDSVTNRWIDDRIAEKTARDRDRRS